jgi:hypothetical protein
MFSMPGAGGTNPDTQKTSAKAPIDHAWAVTVGGRRQIPLLPSWAALAGCRTSPRSRTRLIIGLSLQQEWNLTVAPRFISMTGSDIPHPVRS